MGIRVDIRNGVFTRHQTADHDVGNAMRRQIKDAPQRKRDGNSPFNEAASMTPEEYEILKRIRPQLFDRSLDPITRRNHWITFLNTSEGRMFRVR